MAKINCKMTLSLGELFFTSELSDNIIYMICEHLAKCDDCRKTYLKYLKKHNLVNTFYNFYVVLDGNIKNLQTGIIAEAYNTDIENVIIDNKLEVQDENNMRWLDFAKEFDIYKLAQLKCFRDFTREYNSVGDDGTFDYNEFNKYMAIKFCKQIDYLEDCYNKEFKEIKK